MKRWLVAILLICACVHRIPLTIEERCAAYGMTVEGVNLSSDSTIANVGGVVAVGAGEGENVQCRKPTTAKQACEISAAQASLKVKTEFSTLPRNMVLYVGYAMFVIPGALLWILFDSQRDDAIEAAGAARLGDAWHCRD